MAANFKGKTFIIIAATKRVGLIQALGCFGCITHTERKNMSSNAYDVVRNAIANKHIIVATYQDHVREMCPHVIGRKNGREQALFYQFGGTSSSGPIIPDALKNWRCIPIDGLSNVSSKPGEWCTAANHSRPQTCVDEIDLEVDL